MESLLLRFLTTCLIVAAVAGGVLWHQASIDGHWHIVRRTGVSFSGLYTLDVADVTEEHYVEGGGIKHLKFDDHLGLGSGIGGTVDRLHREIYVYPHCFGMRITYRRWGDSLFLTAANYDRIPTGSKAVAVRCNGTCCDPQSDLFAETGLAVDLPIREVSQVYNDTIFHNGASVMSLVIGRDVTGAFVTNFYGNRRFQPEDVPIYVEQHLIKLPERIHNKLKLRFYADRDTPKATLDSIVSVFLRVQPQLGVERVYREEKLRRPLKLFIGN